MSWTSNEAPCERGLHSRFTGSTSNQQLLDLNEDRNGFSVYNEGSETLYLLLGEGTASSTNYTVAMAADSYFEAPYNFLGVVSGVWGAAGGFANVTEFL